MKALVTTSGTFGPFTNITLLSDRYQCDGAQLQFSVVGLGEIVEADTVVWPAPPEEPTPIPQQVTMRQARLALHAAGLLEGVDAAIASVSEPNKTTAKIEWEYAQTVERNAGLVPAIAGALGMTEEQIDQLFISASIL